MAIRVGLIEDDARLRASLTEIIVGDPECECIGAFGDGETALSKLPDLAPQVVIADINLPGMDGIECVRRLSPLLADTQFLMLTVYRDNERIFDALTAGAHGYLLKPVRAAQLRAAIRDVVAGGVPMTGMIARQILERLRQPERRSPPAESALGAQEWRVLELLSQGLLYKQVATELDLSFHTVCEYIRRIYRKLQVHSRHEAVMRFRELRGDR